MARTKGSGKSTAPKKPWKKILYGSREYPDNYTDSSFLQELRTNVHVHTVSFREAILGAGRVTNAICIVVLFSIVFVYLYNQLVDANTVFVYSCAGSILGYLWYRSQSDFQNGYWTCFYRDARMVAIFLSVGFASSPILKTLTETISTDTIYAMTVFMMLLHLCFKDYGVSPALVSSSLSFNAAIFGSICLASRLASSFHAFVLLSLSVEAFVLLPLLMVEAGRSLCILILVISVTIGALWSLSPPMTVFFVLLICFVNLICPIWFLKWQIHKENIYGPWDEAVVEDADNIVS
ncbi:phosphatidylinositol N-acetylglucosaminyltransferase subunit C [Thrips palmi]|uniref:Phosphatidylinositol N-acetylglucosaminyltransferase subunit C n=1 Tax=Thrips palmi TaxID=161013 RepID=A0A6P8Y754_THRPL|nr:phosphatidylinositol N-acetylglucosaminyltransferase subunit C [Thrips palmi]